MLLCVGHREPCAARDRHKLPLSPRIGNLSTLPRALPRHTSRKNRHASCACQLGRIAILRSVVFVSGGTRPTGTVRRDSPVFVYGNRNISRIARQGRLPVDAIVFRHGPKVLFAEGFPFFVPKMAGILVYATNTTTKLQQQARRRGQART